MGPPLTWSGQFGTGWLPAGQATWSADRVERLPPTFYTDSGFSSSFRCVATKAQAEQHQTLTGQLALRPLDLGSGPLGPRVKYTPVVMSILTFCQLHFVIP
jgi:hypothetical protein